MTRMDLARELKFIASSSDMIKQYRKLRHYSRMAGALFDRPHEPVRVAAHHREFSFVSSHVKSPATIMSLQHDMNRNF